MVNFLLLARHSLRGSISSIVISSCQGLSPHQLLYPPRHGGSLSQQFVSQGQAFVGGVHEGGQFCPGYLRPGSLAK